MKVIERLRAIAAEPELRAALARVLISMGAVAVGYLILANVLLQSRIIRDIVSEGPDRELRYASAYSLWPGRVRFERLELVAQDHNVQFAVGVQAGSVDVSLHELFFKRFHAVRLSLEGLSFRFRHKVHAVGDNRSRVEAYPPIAGYPDPPLYAGPKPPRQPGEEDELWRIELENIGAELAELWLQELRYLGPGSVDGGFELAPGRYFEVFSSDVKLAGGALTSGDRVVAPSLVLEVGGRIDHTETDMSGPEMFRNANLRLALNARAADASILDLYLAGDAVSVTGGAEIDARLALAGGHFESASRAALRLQDLSVSTPQVRLLGSGAIHASMPAPDIVELVATSPALRFENDSGHKAPELEAARLTARVGPLDLASPVELRQLLIELPDVSIPSLGWSNRHLGKLDAPLEIGGRLAGEAKLGLSSSAGPSASFELRLVGGELERKDVRAALSGHFELELEPEPPENPTSTGRLEVELDGVRVAVGEAANGKPFRAAIRSPDLQVRLQPEPRLSGTFGVQAAPADTLLSLVLGSPLLEELAASLLDLKRLEASVRMHVDRSSTRVELSSAESGALRGQGFWHSPLKGAPNGAFLVTSDVANVGVVLRGSETETALFVADDWLTRRSPAKRRTGSPANRPVSKKKPPP